MNRREAACVVKGAIRLSLSAMVCAAAAVTLVTSCSKPPSTPVDAQGVLVEAGCLMAGDDSGEFQQALQSGAYPWLNCIAEGGTISGCGVPCE